MPALVSQRTATPEERSTLQALVASAPTAAMRFKQGAENGLVMWAASLLVLVLAWLALGWVAGKVLHVDLGLRSPATLWALAIATPVCAGYAVLSSVRWVRGWKNHRPLLQADLVASRVIEEQYDFVDVKRFQEPEHGGLMYFLRTAQDEAFTLYDRESQDLGANDEDPLKSAYRPQARLLIVRAPQSGFVLTSIPSGAVLNVGAPIDLAVPPEQWPDEDMLSGIPWSQLEARLGTASPNDA